jgi:high-affinity iron transporter
MVEYAFGQPWRRDAVSRRAINVTLGALGFVIIGALIWQGVVFSGVPDPSLPGLAQPAVVVNSALLVFREGLEAILVLAAITGSFVGVQAAHRRPVFVGSSLGILASLVTWFIAVVVIDAVDAPALAIQAVTGVLAIIVLLLIMNWFFHRIYWTGWITSHTRRKRALLGDVAISRQHLLLGLLALGFTAIYREGFEIVLFLQSLRLQAGSGTVAQGVAIGLAAAAVVAVVTFRLEQKLPYKKMLVLTGVLLGGVLIVMVGESVQELQLAGWLTTHEMNMPIPGWMGIWFAVFPNWESMLAQLLAAAFVIGSFVLARTAKLSSAN